MQFIVHDLEDEFLVLVQPNRLTRYGKRIAMLAGNDSDAHVNVRKESEILVVHNTGGFTYVARAQ